MAKRTFSPKKFVGRLILVAFLSPFAAVGIDFVSFKLLGFPPILALVLHELPFRGEYFDQTAWNAAGSCKGLNGNACVMKEMECRRGRMVHNLLQWHLQVGKAKRETVVALLGPEDRSVRIRSEECEGYNLGMCSGLGFDYDSLYFCYAEDGTVTSAGHVQH